MQKLMVNMDPVLICHLLTEMKMIHNFASAGAETWGYQISENSPTVFLNNKNQRFL